MIFDLEQFIFALSDTVDLVGIDDILHGKRVAYMAWECSRALGHDADRQRNLLHLGMLHDCGVSSTEERHKINGELEWHNSQSHCETGAKRMAYFPPLEKLAQPILYHHTRWDNLIESELDGNSREDANLIYLLDRVDYFCQIFPGNNWLDKKDMVRHKVQGFSGSFFSKTITEAFTEASTREAFWFGLEPIMLQDFFDRQKKERKRIEITLGQLRTVSQIFAEIVDAKSPYTAAHSFGTAELAKVIGKLVGLDEQTLAKVEICALLHDLGKLQVPDYVLASTGPLNKAELSCIRYHSYVTHRILKDITGFEDIAEWAGNHHEALDGSGYPFRKTGEELNIESRIVAIADIFQALAQTRPYRQAKPLEDILAFLKRNVKLGRLDENLVTAVHANSDACYKAALPYQEIARE